MAKDRVDYVVTFVGATPNQAQVIESVIKSIEQLRAKDELPMNKYQNELVNLNTDFILFKDVYTTLSTIAIDNNILVRVKERMDYYENEIKTRELKIKNHKENVDFINEYIAKVRSFIKEKVNGKEKTVTYTYDMTYLTPFLDLAVIIFELSFEEQPSKAS